MCFHIVELRQRELDRERQKREWEMKERQAEEQRLADEERMRRQQEEMQLRMHHQEEEMRRRQQENTLFMQVIFRIGTWSIGVEALTCLYPSGHTVAFKIDLAPNRNTYQGYLLGGKGGQWIGLTLPPSCADCLEILWAPTSGFQAFIGLLYCSDVFVVL